MAGERASTKPIAIARLIAAAVRKMTGVAAIGEGIFGLVGTFGIAGVVPGIVVSVRGGRLVLEIHVVASAPIATCLDDLADQIRATARATLAGLPSPPPIERIDIAIDDLDDPTEPRHEETPA